MTIWSCLLDHLPCSMGKYGEAWPWFTKISLLQGAARSLPVMPWYLPVHPISIVKWFDEILQGSSRFFTCHFHPRYWKHTSYIVLSSYLVALFTPPVPQWTCDVANEFRLRKWLEQADTESRVWRLGCNSLQSKMARKKDSTHLSRMPKAYLESKHI